MNPGKTRRDFIKNAATGVLASLAIPVIASAAIEGAPEKKVTLEKNDIILFQGDSITDWHRSYDSRAPNTLNTLGSGFVYLAAGEVLAEYAAKNLRIYNKGVSGNKVFQLADRWQTDCLTLKPDVLSILIGVNDFFHGVIGEYTGTVETYTTGYRALVKRTLLALPKVKLLICEPFATPGTLVNEKWHPGFDAYRKAARDIATDFDVPFLPFQSVFDKALTYAPPSYWSIDGVHPTLAGAALMAKAWREMMV